MNWKGETSLTEHGADEIVLGNVYNKYASRNPVARYLFNGFMRSLEQLLEPLRPRSILEVGCGEGLLAGRLSNWKKEARLVGIDLSPQLFDPEIRALPGVYFSAQSAYSLGFPDGAFDLVVGAEVLEHLEAPGRALDEIARVARRDIILSVPREPIWRILNVARLSYLSQWGNTPGHVQHWSSRSFADFVSRRLDVVKLNRPLPWTMLHAQKRSPETGRSPSENVVITNRTC